VSSLIAACGQARVRREWPGWTAGAWDDGSDELAWSGLRTDGARYLVTRSCESLLTAIRADDAEFRYRPEQADRDPLMERLRGQFPSWAIAELPSGTILARRWAQSRRDDGIRGMRRQLKDAGRAERALARR